MNRFAALLATAGALILVAVVLSAMLHADKAVDSSWLSLGEMLADPRGVVAWIAAILGAGLGVAGFFSFARRRFGD